MVWFYSQGAPPWWPFHIVTVSQPWLSADHAVSVIVDNNAFTFYRRGEFPRLDLWAARIARVAAGVRPRATSVTVVLPDCPLDPLRTLLWARQARWLCRHYQCMVVMHYDALAEEELEAVFETYVADVDADLYAVPLKLPLSKGYNSLARRVSVDPKLQKHVVRVASRVVGGARLHLMAPRKETVVSLWRNARSFDTTAWTRASARVKKLLKTISARDQRERELLFALYVLSLAKAGVGIDADLVALADAAAWGLARSLGLPEHVLQTLTAG